MAVDICLPKVIVDLGVSPGVGPQGYTHNHLPHTWAARCARPLEIVLRLRANGEYEDGRGGAKFEEELLPIHFLFESDRINVTKLCVFPVKMCCSFLENLHFLCTI